MKNSPGRAARSRHLWLFLLGPPALCALPVARVAARIEGAGMVRLTVEERGSGGPHFAACIPGALVPGLLRYAPRPKLTGRGEFARDREPSRALEAARAAVEMLARAPEGLYVDVETATRVLRLEKRAGHLEFLAENPKNLLRASVPVSCLRWTLEAL